MKGFLLDWEFHKKWFTTMMLRINQKKSKSGDCLTFIENLKHSSLVGVADPTGKLPQGTIFLPGYTSDVTNRRVLFGECHNEVFITRAPCMEGEDGKLLKVVGTKPHEMSISEWDFLCGYPFGQVVFSKVDAKFKPLPTVVGQGDLDGDMYLVVWDETLLFALQKSKHVSVLRRWKFPIDDTESNKKLPPASTSWLKETQKKMVETQSMRNQNDLTGKLFNHCMKKTDLFDEDTHFLSDAYKDSLDIRKHGGKVFLPPHLHELVPEKLRDALS